MVDIDRSFPSLHMSAVSRQVKVCVKGTALSENLPECQLDQCVFGVASFERMIGP